MKKMILMITIPFMLLMYSTDAPANYLIELKSGKIVVTSYYWKEDGQIIFYQLGGVVGYPADLVERIIPADRPQPVETPWEEPKMDAERPQETRAAEQGDMEEWADLDMDPEEFQAKVEQYQAALRTLLLDRRQYYMDLEVAKRNNDESAIKELQEIITDLQYKRMALRREVLDFYGNEFPDWWDEYFEVY